MDYAKFYSETSISFAVPFEADYEGVHYSGDLTQRPDILASLGFYPVVNADEPMPEPDPGYHVEERFALEDVGEDSKQIVRSWIVVKDEPLNRSLSKRKLMNAFKNLGIWDQVKGFLVQQNYWEDFDLSTTLDEQEEMMQSAIVALRVAFELSDERIEEIISNSVAD